VCMSMQQHLYCLADDESTWHIQNEQYDSQAGLKDQVEMVYGDEDQEGYTDTHVPLGDSQSSPHLPAFHDQQQVGWTELHAMCAA
jgi:hypothetical protein